MAQHLMARSEVLDELEDHLQDEVERLTRAGHSPDDAVEVAMARLGRPSELAAEFAKVPSSAPWLPVRVAFALGALLAASMVMPLWPKLAAGGVSSLLATHMGLVMLGYVATLLVGFLAACYFVARLFHGLSDGQARTLKRAAFGLSGLAVALTGVGIAFGSLFCPNEKTGWAFGLDTREVGGLGILAWNVVMLAGCWLGRHSERLGAMMLLGLAGNVAVVLGWLGASAVERHLHGSPASFTPVMVLLLMQLALGCLALAPAGCLHRGRAT
jgi:hypothetical protein